MASDSDTVSESSGYGFICANWSEDNPTCTREGKFACKECLLVLYCTRACQVAHWKAHKPECRNNPLLKPTWQPQWAVENRPPKFMAEDGSFKQCYRTGVCPWGGLPAYDLVKLASNEGLDYGKDLSLLFVDNKGIRNVIKTIASIPDTFQNAIKITLSDIPGNVTCRNVLLLLLLLEEKDPVKAAENVIHLWYSAFMPESLRQVLQGRLFLIIESVCIRAADKANDAIVSNTWTFGSRSLQVALTKHQWYLLLKLVISKPPPLEQAQRSRRKVMLAKRATDWRERYYYSQTPGARASSQKFKEEGILLPFGTPRAIFTVPNFTFFQYGTEWPLADSTDPLQDWTLLEIMGYSPTPASNDLYGKLFAYLRDTISRVHRRLEPLKISFHVRSASADLLYRYIKPGTYDRIDVHSICEASLLGLPRTLDLVGRLLKHPEENPHATLVGVFVAAVHKTFLISDREEQINAVPGARKQVLQYLQFPPPTAPYDPDGMRGDMAMTLFNNFDKYFHRYMKTHNFVKVIKESSMEMKARHTIIKAWPFRIRKKADQDGGKEEFFALLASPRSGSERYCEWQHKKEA
ncbi:hypothetical protein GGR52DRAFT_538469 [Hypoxylon sp. FL1284]|nr:hypothetical protein GGR52DRAFT_538469 [Hypoxylon sp. FL1284]